MGANPDYFFNCDWGTTSFRLRLVRVQDARVIAEETGRKGAGVIASHSRNALERALAFQSALQEGLEAIGSRVNLPLHEVPVIISGMATSTIGWKEIPYAKLPFALDGRSLSWTQAETVVWSANSRDGSPVFLLSGVCSDIDIMRGEETEILGIFQIPNIRTCSHSCQLILPGTHSKHVVIRDGEMIEFQTYMTGELFDVLCSASILQHSVSPSEGSQEDSHKAFLDGLAASEHKNLLHNLFRVRTRQVLQKIPGAENRNYLSGLLIGTELREMARQYGFETSVVLLAQGQLGELYEEALNVIGFRNLLFVRGDDAAHASALGQLTFLVRQYQRKVK